MYIFLFNFHGKCLEPTAFNISNLKTKKNIIIRINFQTKETLVHLLTIKKF